MKKVTKVTQKILQGKWADLATRSFEEFAVRKREFKQYQTGKPVFTLDLSSRIFSQPFIAKYATGNEIDFVRAIADYPSTRFFAGFSDISAFRAFVAHQGPLECERICATADSILENRFPIFSLDPISYGNPPQWNYEPLANITVPNAFYSHISYLNPESAGDSKVLWEISRLQFVYDLGQAYILTGSETYANKCLDLVCDWSIQHRDYEGIAFCSSLEFAFRIYSLCWTISFFKNSPSLTQKRAYHIFRLLYISADFISHHLSTYFSPNTHLLGEAWALYLAALLFPEFLRARRWLTLGERVLTAELEKQFTAEGMHSEMSTAYHGYALEFILSAAILSKRAGHVLPKRFQERICQMIEVFNALQRPDGLWPNAGDQDGGRLHFLSRVSPADFRPIVETAQLFIDCDRSTVAKGRYCESFWLLGAQYKDSSEIPQPTTKSTYLSSSGFAVFKSEGRCYSLLHCGPFGYKDSPHSHGDMLHLDLSVGKDNFLIDPGTYTYTSDIQLRNTFRSEARHNGPVPEGLHLPHPTDPFAWQEKPDCKVKDCFLGSQSDFVEAHYQTRSSVSGFTEIRRAVLFIHDLFWIIADKISLKKPGRISWHFTSPFQIEKSTRTLTVLGRNGFLSLMPTAHSPSAITQEIKSSFYSEDYLSRKPCSDLLITMGATTYAQTSLLAVPHKAANESLQFETVHDRGIDILSFKARGKTIRIRAGKQASEFEGLQTDAKATILIQNSSGTQRCLVLDATYLKFGNSMIFESSSRHRLADIHLTDAQLQIELAESLRDIRSLAPSAQVIQLTNLVS